MAEQKAQGSKLYVYSSADAYVEVTGIAGINGPGGQRAKIDTTDLGSTAAEFEAGVIDNGDVVASGKFNPDDEGQARLLVLHGSGAKEQFKIEYPDGKTRTFEGIVFGAPTDSQQNQMVNVQYTITVSGAITNSW